MKVGDLVPPGATLEQIRLEPNEFLVLALGGPVPDGFLATVEQTIAMLPKGTVLLILDQGMTLQTATVDELELALEQKKEAAKT